MSTTNNTLRIVLVGLLMAATGAGGYWLGARPGQTGQLEAQAAEKKVKYWQAPMDPTEIYDQPGKSKMGMDLIPVYEDSATEDLPSGDVAGTVVIDPATAQNMGVRTEMVRRVDLSRVIRTVGDVSYNEEGLHVINSKISGWIERLYVNYVGDSVRRGDPLLEIYSPELVSTQEEYLLAVRGVKVLGPMASPAMLQDARRLVDAARKRLEFWDIPEPAIARLESTGQVQRTVQINAPATGVVIERMAVSGSYIRAGMDLFRIANLSTVWVHASFYDNELPWIAEGQAVEMELSYLPGKTYRGRIDYIYPYLREKARDVHVRLIFQNSSGFDLKPGMYANLKLEGRTVRDAVVVPAEAVIRSGARTLVFVAREGGRFEPREIRTGEQGGPGNNLIRVLDGLQEGEQIVVSAQFLIDSESRLQEAIEKMLAGRSGSGAEKPGMDHSEMAMPAAPKPVRNEARMDSSRIARPDTARHHHDG